MKISSTTTKVLPQKLHKDSHFNNWPLLNMASYTAHSSYVPINHNSSPPSILSLIPCIGPLHVSLNGREMLFNDFSPFPANIYEQLFPKCKLGKDPKPWRINMIFETVYGGWLNKRDSVKDKFKQRRLLPSSQSAWHLLRRDCFRSVWWKQKFYLNFGEIFATLRMRYAGKWVLAQFLIIH